jgi:hypothetical protein
MLIFKEHDAKYLAHSMIIVFLCYFCRSELLFFPCIHSFLFQRKIRFRIPELGVFFPLYKNQTIFRPSISVTKPR